MTTPNWFNGYIFAILHSLHHIRTTTTSRCRLKAYLIFPFLVLLSLVCMLPDKFAKYMFVKKDKLLIELMFIFFENNNIKINTLFEIDIVHGGNFFLLFLLSA